jgi:Spy/CpxP family protein refolding chaperone
LQRSLTRLVVATAAMLAGLAFAAATASAENHVGDTTDNSHVTIAPVKSAE